MTVRFNKARGKWQYDFIRNGVRYANNCVDPDDGSEPDNKTEAKRIEKKIQVAIEQMAKDGDAATKRLTSERAREIATQAYTVTEAFSAYATRKRGGKNWENDRIYVRELVTWFGPHTDVRDITDQRIWDYITWARQQPVLVYIGGSRPKAELVARGIDPASLWKPAEDGRLRSDSTINRYLVALRETLSIAHAVRDREGRPTALPVLPKVPDLAEPEIMPRPIADDVLWEMVDAAPAHLAWGLLLARLMGFRKGEMFAIKCNQVDLANGGIWLPAASTKANRDEFVPAGEQALELLEYLLAEAKARRTDYLITYRRRLRSMPGEPITFTEARPIANPKRAWGRVLTDLGLKGVHRFHHTKASFVSAVGATASAAVTQKLARHKDHRTTERYLLVNDQLARAAVNAAAISVNPPSHRQKSTDGFSSGPKNENAARKAAFSLKNLVGAAGFEPTTPSPPD